MYIKSTDGVFTFFLSLTSPLCSSDKEGNIAVILQHVALQDVRAGTQDAFEPSTIQFDALERSSGRNSCSSRSVKKQSDFSEVFRRTKSTDLHRITTLIADLERTIL